MKGKGIFGFAKEIITFILIAGLFFAFLALFNNDVAALIRWGITTVWEAITAVKDWILQNKLLESFVK